MSILTAHEFKDIRCNKLMLTRKQLAEKISISEFRIKSMEQGITHISDDLLNSMRQLATNAAKIPDAKNIEFKRLRHHLGWSQHALAVKLACSQAFISDYEIGKFEIPEVYLQTLRDLVKSNKMKEVVVVKHLTQDQIEFKKIRHKLNLTQKQLSERIGLALSTISAIENGTISAVKCNRLQILRDFDAKSILIPTIDDLTNTAIEFKRLRNFLGLSRRQLSEKLNLKRSHYITRWENGERHIPSEMFQTLRDLVKTSGKGISIDTPVVKNDDTPVIKDDNKFFFVKDGETIYTSFTTLASAKQYAFDLSKASGNKVEIGDLVTTHVIETKITKVSTTTIEPVKQ